MAALLMNQAPSGLGPSGEYRSLVPRLSHSRGQKDRSVGNQPRRQRSVQWLESLLGSAWKTGCPRSNHRQLQGHDDRGCALWMVITRYADAVTHPLAACRTSSGHESLKTIHRPLRASAADAGGLLLTEVPLHVVHGQTLNSLEARWISCPT